MTPKDHPLIFGSLRPENIIRANTKGEYTITGRLRKPPEMQTIRPPVSPEVKAEVALIKKALLGKD